MSEAPKPHDYVAAIRASRLTIYDPIRIGDPFLWVPTPELEVLLNESLKGTSLAGLPIRTRSKIVKEHVCRALGYPVPLTFLKTKPRFPGQMFDTYTQKANNLQIWNEELSGTRRYVLIRISAEDVVIRVKVVTGDSLAILDTTGTLTQKYQARCIPGSEPLELVASSDTSRLVPFVSSQEIALASTSPVAQPRSGELLPIDLLYKKLEVLIGKTFDNAGSDQERNRGAALHRLVCDALGYAAYQDDGQFPDVRHQLLEVKLQTASTVDLGLVRPNSTEPLDVPMIGGQQIRHCDVRYAIVYAVITGRIVKLTHIFLTTGEAFFGRFPQCQGKVLNAKLQIPLPTNFFTT